MALNTISINLDLCGFGHNNMAYIDWDVTIKTQSINFQKLSLMSLPIYPKKLNAMPFMLVTYDQYQALMALQDLLYAMPFRFSSGSVNFDKTEPVKN